MKDLMPDAAIITAGKVNVVTEINKERIFSHLHITIINFIKGIKVNTFELQSLDYYKARDLSKITFSVFSYAGTFPCGQMIRFHNDINSFSNSNQSSKS